MGREHANLQRGRRDPAYNYYRTRKYGGVRKRFIKSARVYLGSDSQLYSPCRDQQYFVGAGHEMTTFDAYRALIRHAYTHNVSLSGFISPLHSWYCEIIRLNGMWPLWETWKKELVRINEEEAHAAGKSLFPLWDFSGYNAFTAEPLPLLEDTETLAQWHWEASHYRKELGDLVLNTILDYDCPGQNTLPDFGGLLNSATIESSLDDIITRQRAYHRQDAPDVELLEKMAREKKQPR